MHTSVAAACDRDDDGAPEVFACYTFPISNLSEMLLRVNRKLPAHQTKIRISSIGNSGMMGWADFRSIAIATTWFNG
jgi:hypothetical protein